MRDLTQVSGLPRRPAVGGKFLKLVAVVGVLVAVIYLVKNFVLGGSTGGGSSVVLREAPRGLVPVTVENGGVATEGGAQLTVQTAAMQDVRYGGEATATIKRSFGGGIYILSVDATMPDPKNVSYQVWLVGGSGIVPIDYMRGSGTSWSLNLRDSDRYSVYDGIWITLERSKDDIPEEHVMEGSF